MKSDNVVCEKLKPYGSSENEYIEDGFDSSLAVWGPILSEVDLDSSSYGAYEVSALVAVGYGVFAL